MKQHPLTDKSFIRSPWRTPSKLGAALLLVLAAACATQQLLAQESRSQARCEAPEFFGICDPFVPGTRISQAPKEPIRVFSTWPDGPAEKAGICPGDQIVAVNAVSVLENPISRILREIVSASPTDVLLKVKRRSDEIEFRVPRVRESTLAQLSRQRWVRGRKFMEGEGPTLVPFEETPEEFGELQAFVRRIDRRYGFRLANGFLAPNDTPDEQIKKVLGFRPGARQSERFVQRMWFGEQPDSYTPGFSALGLKDPDEVLVDLVFPRSPAHRAGFFPGDQLLAVDGRPVSGLTPKELGDLLSGPEKPRPAKLTVKRRESTINVELETQKASEFLESNFYLPLPSQRWPLSGDQYILGVSTLHAENPREAIVAQVDYPSPAFETGLHVGDLILAINDTPIDEIDRKQLEKILSPTLPSETVFKVSRLGKQLTFRVTPVTYAQALAKIGRKVTKFGPAPRHCPDS